MQQNRAIQKADITYEKQISLDDLVVEASGIFDELRRRKIHSTEHEKLDAFYNEMYKAHKEFAVAYPIVLKYMCMIGLYDNGVFRRHVKYISENPYKGEDDYLDAQADYVAALYRKFMKRWDTKTIAKIRNDTRAKLKAETETFKKLAEQWVEESKKLDAKCDAANKKDFASFFEENRDFFEQDGAIPIVAKSDVAESNAAAKLESEIARLKDEVEDPDFSIYLD